MSTDERFRYICKGTDNANRLIITNRGSVGLHKDHRTHCIYFSYKGNVDLKKTKSKWNFSKGAKISGQTVCNKARHSTKSFRFYCSQLCDSFGTSSLLTNAGITLSCYYEWTGCRNPGKELLQTKRKCLEDILAPSSSIVG